MAATCRPAAGARASQARNRGIGGSDANVILSGDEDRILRLWREKRGEAEPEDLSGKLSVALGCWTEPFNRQWYEKISGKRVVRAGEQLTSAKHRWRKCTLDGVVHESGAVFEAKHTSSFVKPEEVLERYMPQLQHNMAVADVDRAVLSVIFGNSKYQMFEVAADWLYRAIHAISAELAGTGIAKLHRNERDDYLYRSIDDVLNRLAPLLARHKLCILPRVLERSATDRVGENDQLLVCVTLKVAFDVVSTSDGSRHTVEAYGEALDPSYKATAKAMSSAYKQAMLQAFCVPVRQIADADASSHRLKRRTHASCPVEGWEQWAAGIRDIAASCMSQEALERLQDRNRAMLTALSRERPDLYSSIGASFASRAEALKSEGRDKQAARKNGERCAKRAARNGEECASQDGAKCAEHTGRPRGQTPAPKQRKTAKGDGDPVSRSTQRGRQAPYENASRPTTTAHRREAHMLRTPFPKRLEREPCRRREARECPAHRAWVRRHRCCVPGCQGRPIDCAHVRTDTDGGVGLKPSDRWSISLCRDHHIEQHQIGETAFERRYDLDLRGLAGEFASRSPHRAKPH